MLLERLGLRHPAGVFHRREDGQEVVAQLREPLADEPHDGGTGRADDRKDDIRFAHIAAGTLRDDLGGAGDLVVFVEAAPEQGLEQTADVLELVELAVQRGSGKDDPPFEFGVDVLQPVENGLLGLMLTHADAVAAVDTELCPNLGAPVTDPNGLGGALPQTGGTAYALVRIQRNRMLIFCHWDNLPVRVISVLPL